MKNYLIHFFQGEWESLNQTTKIRHEVFIFIQGAPAGNLQRTHCCLQIYRTERKHFSMLPYCTQKTGEQFQTLQLGNKMG